MQGTRGIFEFFNHTSKAARDLFQSEFTSFLDLFQIEFGGNYIHIPADNKRGIMKFKIVFGIAWSLFLGLLSVFVISWVSHLPINEFSKLVIQGAYAWIVFFLWAYPLWLLQRNRPKKNTLISDASREHMKPKSDADLQTIIDNLNHNPADLIRQAAVEEQYSRIERIRKRKLWMGLIALTIALFSLLIAAAQFFRVP
jgi:hypothetical protein